MYSLNVPDMREHFVIDPLIGKRQQLLLATQLCRMVLKVGHTRILCFSGCTDERQINNVIIAGEDDQDF